MKYRKRPVTVDAFMLTPSIDAHYPEWFLAAQQKGDIRIKKRIQSDVETVQGCTVDVYGVKREASVGDFIIQLANGEIYSHSPDTFNRLYEKAEE